MSDQTDAILAGVGIVFIITSLALGVPALLLALDGPTTTVLTQTEGEQIAVSSQFFTTATSITSGGNAAANITIVDESTGDSAATGELSEGGSTTVTVSGFDITVTIEAVIDGSTALVSYEYPVFMGWPESAKTIAENLGLVVIISGLFGIVGGIMSLLALWGDRE